MRRIYTQMIETGSEHPLDLYNELSKPQQRIFTFLLKRALNNNQQVIKNTEIAERLKVRTQHVSPNMKAIISLDMIRRGRHDMVMVNPNMWFFGRYEDRVEAIKVWDSLE